MKVKSMLKKYIIILPLVLILMLITSCNRDPEYKSPDQIATEMQAKIMECFLNGDQERIKDMLCEKCKKSPDIDEQIKKAFKFIDGEIISYNKDHWGSSGGAYERKDIGGHTSEVMTNKGTEYTISYKAWLTNEEDPDLVGVYFISIKNDTEFNKYDLSEYSRSEIENILKKCIVYVE